MSLIRSSDLLNKLQRFVVSDAIMVLDWMGYEGGYTSEEDVGGHLAAVGLCLAEAKHLDSNSDGDVDANSDDWDDESDSMNSEHSFNSEISVTVDQVYREVQRREQSEQNRRIFKQGPMGEWGSSPKPGLYMVNGQVLEVQQHDLSYSNGAECRNWKRVVTEVSGRVHRRAMVADITWLIKTMAALCRYRGAVQVLVTMMERARLANRVGEWQLAQRAARGRYERGMRKNHGSEAGFPDWFDDDMVDWVNQRQVEIAMENGVLMFNWAIQKLQVEWQFQRWKIGWRIYDDSGNDVTTGNLLERAMAQASMDGTMLIWWMKKCNMLESEARAKAMQRMGL